MARINDPGAEMLNLQEKFDACPEFKAFLWRYLDNEVSHKRRASVRMAMEVARVKDWSRTDGDPFRVNNSLSPAIARLYLYEHPEALPYIETRKAACDGMEEGAYGSN